MRKVSLRPRHDVSGERVMRTRLIRQGPLGIQTESPSCKERLAMGRPEDLQIHRRRRQAARLERTTPLEHP